MPSDMSSDKAQPHGRKRLEQLEQINLDAAGLDIGATEIWACVPKDRDSAPVRRFETFTADLHQLADWLMACGSQDSGHGVDGHLLDSDL